MPPCLGHDIFEGVLSLSTFQECLEFFFDISRKKVIKHNTTEIAKRMVARCPKSLQDVIDGDVIGLGYHSLVKQLQSRVENVKRPDTPRVKKRQVASDDDTDEISAKQRASVQDMYGCVNWESKHLPLPETVESQLEKRTNEDV